MKRTVEWLFFLAAIVVIGTFFYAAANRQAHGAGLACGDRIGILKSLASKYKESPRALGLASTGRAVFEVYTSKTGTWTILMTTTTGMTCIMAAGRSWEEYDQHYHVPGKPI
ncbi:hypothetical protein [Hoeflea poritis]|uniref:Uncharacterized protein n=1 Tax=Hoeflea poritis TaxID=2993659 RepID=A0ABT4VMN1_9HYPH|nr:hypothetical protein [Hoeflea poritis]MDA4845976.1 hypothetical protein [Hoeflea poritis]